ncbi:type II toxin-antitoxin system VapC family toxin [Fibrella aestuarina]|uniref:type II toxin-antitoxin system VapC family toxin n=1 Tax=Fibrella aestuarina TaxID=651143 RepID=UPI00059E4FE9
MACLIDTQILIWSLVSPSKLSGAALRLLQSDTVYVSEISLFEIAIKQKIDKLPDLPVAIRDIAERMQNDGFILLPLTIQHIDQYSAIPLLPQHRDPFDRILIAVALNEQLPFISADANVRHYTDLVNVIW